MEKLWETATGWLFSPTSHLQVTPHYQKGVSVGESSELVEAQTNLGSSYTQPSLRGSLRIGYLIWTFWQVLVVEGFGTQLIMLCKLAYKFSCAQLVQNIISRDLEAFPHI